VVEVQLPPLRERREDFSLIVDHVLTTASFPHQVRGLSPEVEQIFQDWHWPGNVRELRNVLLRALPFCNGPWIPLDALPDALRPTPQPEAQGQRPLPTPTTALAYREARDQLLDSFERYYLEDLLARAEGNLSKAARLADIDRKTLARMLKRHGLA